MLSLQIYFRLCQWIVRDSSGNFWHCMLLDSVSAYPVSYFRHLDAPLTVSLLASSCMCTFQRRKPTRRFMADETRLAVLNVLSVVLEELSMCSSPLPVLQCSFFSSLLQSCIGLAESGRYGQTSLVLLLRCLHAFNGFLRS